MEIKSLIESMIQEKLDKNKKELPSHLAKLFDKDGNPTPKAQKRLDKHKKAKDVTPKGYGPNEAKGSDYTINHKTFSSAVQHAIEVVEKRGYEVDEEQWDQKVALGPKKPSKGKTNTYTIDLLKNGKETPRKLQMQVYYDEGRYELNMYIS